MANDNTKLQYIVELLTQGDTKKATEELTKLGAAGKTAQTGMDATLAGAKQLFAFLGGSALIKQSIDKFIEAERGINALNAALIQTGHDAPGALEAVQELADALGDDLKVQADDVIKVMTQLLSFGAKPENLKRLTELVYDLSEVMGRDVSRASRQMSQALKGSFELFNQFGIEADKSKSATENLNDAVGKLRNSFGGRWKESVKGAVGDVQGLTVTLQDAIQQIGKWSTSVLTGFNTAAVSVGRMMDGSNATSAEGASALKATYLAMGDELRRQLLLKSKLGDLDKEETERLLKRITAAQDLIRYLHPTAAGMGTPEIAEAVNNLFDQFRTTVAPVGAALGRPATRKASPGQAEPQITTDDLSRQDELRWLDQKAEMEDKIIEQLKVEYDVRQRGEEQADRLSLQAMEDFRNGERVKQDLINQTILTVLDGQDRERAEFEINHRKRLDEISEEKFETAEQYAEAIAAVEALAAAERKRFEESQNGTAQLNQSLQRINEHAQELVASGLVDSLWSIADGSKSAGEAFGQFAASFGKEISQMILKAYALYAIKSLLGMVVGGSGGGSGGSGGGFIGDINGGGSAAALAAAGGQWTAMAGGGMMVNSPTLLPKFGVLAGEAGPELLTVLARPKFERINGVPAQIGSAGGARLAITSAAALAGATGGGGAGGVINLRVTLSPEVKAEVVETSLKNVIVEMHQDSALSRATKRLTA